MRSITRLNEHNLILVGEVEWLGVVQGNRKVERGSVNLGDRRELGNARIFLSDQLRPPESKLSVAGVASRDKHRAIIDRNGDHIFGTTEWVAPERGWVKSATHELGVVTSGFGTPDGSKVGAAAFVEDARVKVGFGPAIIEDLGGASGKFMEKNQRG